MPILKPLWNNHLDAGKKLPSFLSTLGIDQKGMSNMLPTATYPDSSLFDGRLAIGKHTAFMASGSTIQYWKV